MVFTILSYQREARSETVGVDETAKKKHGHSGDLSEARSCG
jgi:hypothetical protein